MAVLAYSLRRDIIHCGDIVRAGGPSMRWAAHIVSAVRKWGQASGLKVSPVTYFSPQDSFLRLYNRQVTAVS